MKIFKDMDDNQCYMTLWSLAFTTFLIFISMLVYNSYENDLIERADSKQARILADEESKMIGELVKSGKDPLELSCLFKFSNNKEVLCMSMIQERSRGK